MKLLLFVFHDIGQVFLLNSTKGFVQLSTVPALSPLKMLYCSCTIRQEGFDPSKVRGDMVLFRDDVAKTFVPLTHHMHEAIRNRSLRL